MRLSQVLLVLAPATAALAQQAALFGGVYLGVELPDPKATPIEVFKNPKNHVAAVVSILKDVADRRKFAPSKLAATELVKHIANFEWSVEAFLGIERVDSIEEYLSVDEAGTEALEDAIDEAIDSSDSLHIALQLSGLLPKRAKSEQDARDLNGRVVLEVIVIDKTPKVTTIKLARVTLDLQVDQDSRAITIPAQHHVLLSVISLRARSEVLQRHAETLADNIKIISLDQFVEFFHSQAAAKSIAVADEWAQWIRPEEHGQLRF
ncbi:hypothetical protein DFQ27_005334 [Actinomortierella ambigua]|uniref:Uncharacterized protein n=1 Tax=Actinomortierella ambigua TaxID=1343610 RepID=A0A9P6QM88_9FUNG|nr:hypothetical protein DFQ27_005334 [Actinomortierella ambigua]